MSYNRALSPGGRRVANIARASDSTVDAYSKRSSFISPRTSGERVGGVIPISTETFLNVAPSGRARRSSLMDPGRSSNSSRIVTQDKEFVRSTSPPKVREYYVVPATSKDPRDSKKTEHKKVYSIDGSGATLLSPADSDRYHRRRRDSEDRDYGDDRRSRGYITRRKDKSIDDEGAFSYTDAAGMFRETQPSWREYRPRRASLDRGGERSNVPSYNEPRTRDGPPVSTRGWDKVNGVGRTRSVREGPREVDRDARDHSQDRGDYNRAREVDDRRDYDSYDEFDYLQREPRRQRRQSLSGRQDRSVSRRGFGIVLDTSPQRHYSEDEYERRPRESGKRREADEREAASREHRPSQVNDVRRPERDDDRPREDRRRVDDRDHGRSDAARLAAGGVAGAAAYGLLKSHGDNDRRDDDRRDRRRVEDDDEDDRRRSKRDVAEAPYPEDDRSLGFAFEGSNKNSTHRDDRPRDDRRNNTDRDDRPRDERRRDTERDERPRDERRKEVDRDDRVRDDRRDNTDREVERSHEDAPLAIMPSAPDPDEEYRRRLQEAQQALGRTSISAQDDPERERRRREREARLLHRHDRDVAPGAEHSPRSSVDNDVPESSVASSRPSELRRRPSIIDQPMPPDTQAQILDNSQSDKRENRVRIVDPPTEEEDKKPRGILKKPTTKFPENPSEMREGVAPLKDSTKKGIPPGARWTKIDRRLVNPEALEEAKERYEERLDCVIVLRVLTKEEIQKLADRTRELRDKRFAAQRGTSHRHDRDRDRRDRDEYSDDGLEDWEREEQRPTRMLEAAPPADSDRRSDHRDREGSYVSSRGGRE